MKSIIYTTFAVCAIAIIVMVFMNLNSAPTVGDRVSYAVDGVFRDFSYMVESLQYQFLPR